MEVFGSLWLIPHTRLSRESAQAFRELIEAECLQTAGAITVFAGAASSREATWLQMQTYLRNGGWVIWERAPRSFDLRNTTARELYVRYRWPLPALVRTYGNAGKFATEPGEAIADFEGKPVAFVKRIGRGGWIELGNMLGPHLCAGDREARLLARALLNVARG